MVFKFTRQDEVTIKEFREERKHKEQDNLGQQFSSFSSFPPVLLLQLLRVLGQVHLQLRGNWYEHLFQVSYIKIGGSERRWKIQFLPFSSLLYVQVFFLPADPAEPK